MRCTHAAAIAQIDQDQLFYLRSHGLPEAAAHRLVVEGFLEAIVEPLRGGPGARRRRRRDRAPARARAGLLTQVSAPRAAPAWQVWTALWIVYIVWGSTYLGIRVLVETAPPLLSTGARFVCAGGADRPLAARARRARRRARDAAASCAPASLVGTLLIGGTGLVAVAEQRGAPSSYAALIFASIPLWVVLLRRLTGERPPAQTYLGVAAGYVGVVAPAASRRAARGRRPRGGG